MHTSYVDLTQLSLQDDIVAPPCGFDAAICMGNSFAHLPDFHGDMRDNNNNNNNNNGTITITIGTTRNVLRTSGTSSSQADCSSSTTGTMTTYSPMGRLLPTTSTTTAATSRTSRRASSTSITDPTSSPSTISWMWKRSTKTATSSGKIDYIGNLV